MFAFSKVNIFKIIQPILIVDGIRKIRTLSFHKFSKENFFTNGEKNLKK